MTDSPLEVGDHVTVYQNSTANTAHYVVTAGRRLSAADHGDPDCSYAQAAREAMGQRLPTDTPAAVRVRAGLPPVPETFQGFTREELQSILSVQFKDWQWRVLRQHELLREHGIQQ